MRKTYITIFILIVIVIGFLSYLFIFNKPTPQEIEKYNQPTITNNKQSINTSDWKTFRSEKFRYEMRYPPSFRFSEEHDVIEITNGEAKYGRTSNLYLRMIPNLSDINLSKGYLPEFELGSLPIILSQNTISRVVERENSARYYFADPHGYYSIYIDHIANTDKEIVEPDEEFLDYDEQEKIVLLILSTLKFTTDSAPLSEDLRQLILKDLISMYASESKSGYSSDISYSISHEDLNDDGNFEFIVNNVRVEDIFVGGASGNQEYLLYQRINSAWQQIGKIGGNQYSILDTKTAGYRDIETKWHISASSYTETIYKWQASTLRYESVISKEVDSSAR